MPWKPHKLRDAEVWARVDEKGALITDGSGRVEVVYKAAPTSKVYRAAAKNLEPTGGAVIELDVGASPAATPATTAASSRATAPRAANAVAPVAGDPIHVWTDGGANPNPGPSGIGVVIVDGKAQRELSEFIGPGTNQIAELTAILRGLQEVPARDRPVIVYSDSAYAIGLMTKNWKAKANVELVDELRRLGKTFPKLSFVKVAGHSGIALNERTDQLATAALLHRRKRV